MYKLVCACICLFICTAKGFESNDTLEIRRTITETISYGFSRASKDSFDVQIVLSMIWKDSILPKCEIANWYRYGKTIAYDTSLPNITYRPLDINHVSAISGSGFGTSSAMDMMVADKYGNEFGFGYNHDIKLVPTIKNDIIVEYEGRFTPWGRGYTQQFDGEFLTKHDTIVVSKLKHGVLRIQVKYK